MWKVLCKSNRWTTTLTAGLLTAAFLLAGTPAAAAAQAIAVYSFDSGTAADSSGSNRNGTAVNVTFTDGAAQFTRNTPSYIRLPGMVQALAGADAISISMWFYHTGTPIDSDYLFYLPASSSGAGLEIYLSATALRIAGRSCAADTRIAKSYPLPENERWYHITAIWDYANRCILCYLNGQKTESTTNDNAAFGQSAFTPAENMADGYISHKNSFASFHGLLDEVHINRGRLSEEDIAALTNAKEISNAPREAELTAQLENRLENALVLCQNSNSVYWQGQRRRIDWADGAKKAYPLHGSTMLPQQFMDDCFGTDTADAVTLTLFGTAYAPLDRLCGLAGLNGLEYQEIAVISREPVFDPSNAADELLLNGLVKRMTDAQHFQPQPTANHAATASQIAHEETPGLYLGSPSILQLTDGSLLASHDYFGPKNSLTEVIYSSADGGQSWTELSRIKGCTWASLFEAGGSIYLMGTDAVFGGVVIFRSNDGGQSWTSGTQLLSAVGKYHTGSVAVLKHNGCIYRAFESAETGQVVSQFQALMLSAPETADLTDAASWTVSNRVAFDKQAVAGLRYATAGWLEGNAVAGPDGAVYNILRTTMPPNADKAVVLKLSPDGKTLSPDTDAPLIDMPGGSHKFSIKYDAASGYYLALVNHNTDPACYNQRNILSLVYSSDLKNWSIAETLLTDTSLKSWQESIASTGYQYADFVIDGTDLRAVVRQATDGNENYHDSNRIVAYTIKDFRKYLGEQTPTAAVSCENNTIRCALEESPADAAYLILARYREGKLQEALCAKREPSADTPQPLLCQMTLPQEEGITVKCFLWDAALGTIAYNTQ